MAGRILGWLMISEPPHQSTEELGAALMASKGSISTNTRLLIQIGLIERLGLPGVRHAYFRLRPNAWRQVINRSQAQLTLLRQLAETGMELVKNKNPMTQQWLVEMRSMYAFLEKEFPAMLRRWELRGRKG